MMRVYRTAALAVLVQVTLFTDLCAACSPPESWQPMPIAARTAGEAVDFAILGNVTKTTPRRVVRRFGGSVYGAEVAVECVYKRAGEQKVYEEVTVIGFGESHDCTNTEVEENRRYIFLLTPFQTDYGVVEYNVQIGAEPATEDNIQAMLSAFACEEPSEPTTAPPTTTPITTTRPPTTAPPTTIPSTTTKPLDKQAENEGHNKPPDGNGGAVASLSCFAAMFALISSWASSF